MNATGIIRRIDDLGRVVIPKEIRRQMRLQEGDPLELYTTNQGHVCFKKYSAMSDFLETIKPVISAIKNKGYSYALYDLDVILNWSGEKSNYPDRVMDSWMEITDAVEKTNLGHVFQISTFNDKFGYLLVKEHITESDVLVIRSMLDVMSEILRF